MSKMKDVEKDQRPYEKCIAHGPEVLTDAELLAVILRSGSREQNSVELADTVLRMNGNQSGILGINHITVEELTKLKGIGTVKAVQIKCIAELSRRIHKKKYQEMPDFCGPEQIAEYYMEDLRHLEQEHLYLILLNTKHRLIKEIELTKGTVNSSIFSPREALIESLRMRAVHMVLMHNHPSGDPTPSREDVLTTKRMQQAGEIIGISLIDHIIIGDNKYISLRKQGYIK